MSWKIFKIIIDWGSRMLIAGVTLEYLFNNYGVNWMFASALFLLYWTLLPWVEYAEEIITRTERSKE